MFDELYIKLQSYLEVIPMDNFIILNSFELYEENGIDYIEWYNEILN